MDQNDIEVAYLIDDLEKARTKVLRAAKYASALLADARVALEAGDLHVVEEYTDRALEALNKAIR